MATILEDFEDAILNLTITGTWARASDFAAAGSWSLKSASIGDNDTTDAIVMVPAQATSLTFSYKVSSETTYDKFMVLIDGVDALVMPNSGEVNWTSKTLDVTGKSQVTFRYSKDVSDFGGLDAAWVDQLTFTSPATEKNASDTGSLLVETANVAQVPEAAKIASDSGRLTEASWKGEPQGGGTPPSIRSSSTASGGSATYSINTPDGVALNDVLIAIQAADRGSTTAMTTPTGGSEWQPLDSLDGLSEFGILQVIRLWWKRAGSSEPGLYSFKQAGGSDGVCLIVAVKDASLTATPKFLHSTDGTGLNVVTPGITPNSGTDLEVRLVAAYAFGTSVTLAPPAGLTPVNSVQSRIYTLAAAAARALMSADPTDPANFVAAVDELDWRAGYTLAIAPAFSGPPQADKEGSDSASVVESSEVVEVPDGIPLSADDTGTLAETASATADVFSSDAATPYEAAFVDASAGSADQGALVGEASMLEVGWAGADQASLDEIAKADVQAAATDSGALVEAVNIAETIGPISSDYGKLTEAAVTVGRSASADIGALIETAEVAVVRGGTDSAQLVESVSIGLGTADSATLVEAVQVEASVTSADSATAADQALVEAPRFATDSAALVETATVADVGREISGLGAVYRRWSAGSPNRSYSAGEPYRAWRAGSPQS